MQKPASEHFRKPVLVFFMENFSFSLNHVIFFKKMS